MVITTTYAGNASRSRHPRTVDEEIRRAAKRALSISKGQCYLKMPKTFRQKSPFLIICGPGAHLLPGGAAEEKVIS